MPVAIFYVLLGASGTSIGEARELKWLYPIVDEPPFWQVRSPRRLAPSPPLRALLHPTVGTRHPSLTGPWGRAPPARLST